MSTIAIGLTSTRCGAASPATEAAQSAEQEFWLVVSVNRSETPEPALLLRLADGRLLARGEDLQRWRLAPPSGAQVRSDDSTFYPLEAFPGLTYALDETRQMLIIDAPPGLFPMTRLNASTRQFAPPHGTVPVGTFFNYDVAAQRSGGSAQLGGLLELGAFNGWGAGINTFLARNYGNGRHVVRLETTWTRDEPAELASLRFGDAISGSASWGNAVRFGGVQWATDFATQPGFVPFPLPQFSGAAAMPSSVDLLVNNVRHLSEQVPAGPFAIENLPVVSGAGEAQVVVRDVLGREQVASVPYYVSPSLLRSGLDAFSYEAGFEREAFGVESNAYGPFFAAATERHGFTDTFTGEIHAEARRRQQTVGLGGTVLFNTLGTLNMAVAGSRSDRSGSGGLLDVGWQRQARSFSVGADVQLATPRFTQLGWHEGELAPREIARAYATWATHDYGSLGLSYSAQLYRDRESTRTLVASYSASLGSLGYLSVSAARLWSLTPRASMTYGVTLTRPLSQDTSAGFEASHEQGANQALVNVQRNLPAGDGFGYRVQIGGGPMSRSDAMFSLQNSLGTYSIEGERFGGGSSFRGNVSGGLVWFGGDWFMSRRIDQSFGVVQIPGYPNVRIYADNQEIARTNANGNALVPHLRAYENNPIGIEQADLPLDAQVDAVQLAAVPALRSGVLLPFPVRLVRGGTITVLLENGSPIPAGAIAHIEGQSHDEPVGMQGKVFLTDLAVSNRVRVSWHDQACAFLVLFAPNQDPLPDLGDYVCRGVRP